MIIIEPNINLALLVLRIGLALVFLAHGPAKLMNPIQIGKNMGLTTTSVVLIGILETLGALSVLLGIWPQAGATALAFVMVGAIYFKTQKWGKDFTGENGWELDFIILTAAITLVLADGGQHVLLAP